ncbi:MAG: hypothetical protein O9289_11935 [Rhodobacteraceae bacterium]|nr:hypothetical protein [Paracoccaceae bacterium]
MADHLLALIRSFDRGSAIGAGRTFRQIVTILLPSRKEFGTRRLPFPVPIQGTGGRFFRFGNDQQKSG